MDSGSIILTKPEREDIKISITQEDIRQYQMVKGAIRAGMEEEIPAPSKAGPAAVEQR